MTYTKCPQCSLVNMTADELCERCGAPLSVNDTNAPVQQSTPPNVSGFTFGQDVTTGSRAVKLVIVVALALALGVGAWAFYKWKAGSVRASNKRAERKVLPPRTVEERTRDTMLAYLTQPGFAGTKVGKQVLGPVRLEMLFVPDREVYFSAPGPDLAGESFDSMVARFIIDPKRIEIATDDGTGRLRVGKYSVVESADRQVFFKTPVDNIKFDPATVLKFPFKLATYTVAMNELIDFLENRTIFGGRMHARMEQTRSGRPVIFANHGAFVARPEESSLRRFVDELAFTSFGRFSVFYCLLNLDLLESRSLRKVPFLESFLWIITSRKGWRFDRPDHLPLSNRRETRRRSNGRGVPRTRPQTQSRGGAQVHTGGAG